MNRTDAYINHRAEEIRGYRRRKRKRCLISFVGALENGLLRYRNEINMWRS